MNDIFSSAYALGAYLAFVASFVALVLSSTGLCPALVPALDSPPHLGAPPALALDLALVLVFGVQHSVMARAAFKRAFARLLPARLERSTYVLASAACLSAIALGWAPIAGDLWAARGAGASIALQGLSLGGWGLALASSCAIDHFELFGLKRAARPIFRTPGPYRIVRHPMMLGILVGVWAAPLMTAGHAVFAASMTAYILIGVYFEERALLRELGERYVQYRAEVPMLVPWPLPRRALKPPVGSDTERLKEAG
jgi:protein-S-isoprenylcysteine O-methyltransferase Ste14